MAKFTITLGAAEAAAVAAAAAQAGMSDQDFLEKWVQSEIASDVAGIRPLYPIEWKAKYSQANPGIGIGGFDLGSPADLAFAFDYDHSGKLDHIVLYRPGRGAISIVKNNNGEFMAVYQERDPGNGIGGFDLKDPADRAFAFDYDHSGKLDHIVLYGPGPGADSVVKNNNGQFATVSQIDPRSGIGGFDPNSPADSAFAFDYDHSGKLDHIVLYRPGRGAISIVKNNNGEFMAVYQERDPGNGIGGFDLKDPADRAFAFDYDHSGMLDHIVLYRPGRGAISIVKNDNGQFTAVYEQIDVGIGGFDLKSHADRAIAFDYDHSGKLDHIVLYRPGQGAVFILKNKNGNFLSVYRKNDHENGIGGYDLKSPNDQVFAFDYAHSGKLDHLGLYRPGAGTCSILANGL